MSIKLSFPRIDFSTQLLVPQYVCRHESKNIVCNYSLPVRRKKEKKLSVYTYIEN